MIQGSLAPVSNRMDWTEPGTIYTTTVGDTDITGATITVAVRRQGRSGADLTATVGDGVTLTSPTTGVFQWSFTVAQMRTLCAGTYDVGITAVVDSVTEQIFAGILPVVDGVVD